MNEQPQHDGEPGPTGPKGPSKGGLRKSFSDAFEQCDKKSGWSEAESDANTRGCGIGCLGCLGTLALVGFLAVSMKLAKNFEEAQGGAGAIALLAGWIISKISLMVGSGRRATMRHAAITEFGAIVREQFKTATDQTLFVAELQRFVDKRTEGDAAFRKELIAAFASLFCSVDTKQVRDRREELDRIETDRRAAKERRAAAGEARRANAEAAKREAETQASVQRQLPREEMGPDGALILVGKLPGSITMDELQYRQYASFRMSGSETHLTIDIRTQEAQTMGLVEDKRMNYQVRLPWDFIAGVEPSKELVTAAVETILESVLEAPPSSGYRMTTHIPVPVFERTGWVGCTHFRANVEVQALARPWDLLVQRPWPSAPRCPGCSAMALKIEEGVGFLATVGYSEPEIRLACGQCGAMFKFDYKAGALVADHAS